MIEKIINSFFGFECKIEKTKVKGLALYMTAGREYFMVNVEGLSFLLIKISSNDRFGAISLEKQLVSIKEATNYEVAYHFDKLTKAQRDSLLTRRIPFIAGSDQIYLPFLGIALRNNLKSKSDVYSEKMMPATQSLFLYLLYNHKEESILKKNAAEKLGLTRTSITRASEQLKGMGLIVEERCGKEIRMMAVAEGWELYKSAKQYLISPVQKRLYVKVPSDYYKMVLAGESALSSVSMLGEPKYSTFAIYKDDDSAKELQEVDIKWQDDIDVAQIELWKYNPMLFAKDGKIDPVSLAMSLSKNEDERIQGELERFMEEYQW